MISTRKDKIFVIGNGLDKAHGLRTGYSDFLKHVILTHSEDPRRRLYSDLLTLDPAYVFRDFDDFKKRRKELMDIGKLKFLNNFLYKLIDVLVNTDWSDIEKFYFDELYRFKGNLQLAKQLNEEFKIVIRHLDSYLSELLSNSTPVFDSRFMDIFLKGDPTHLLFLNFNYTPTLKYYLEYLSGVSKKTCEQIQIHGILNSPNTDPIISGYGNESGLYDELKSLDNIYLQNIKSNHYPRNGKATQLRNYIRSLDSFDLVTIGHSLEECDRSLLLEILSSSKLNSIEICYRESEDNYAGFQKLYTNISKFVTPEVRNKILDFRQSSVIPQFTDNPGASLMSFA